MHRRLFVTFLILLLSAFARAGENGPLLADNSGDVEDLRIGLSPAGLRKAERAEKIELYRAAFKGDSEARQAWRALEPKLRTSLLSEFAASKDNSPAREQALKNLARLPGSDDAKGESLAAMSYVAVADGAGAMRELARKALAVRDDTRTPAILARLLRSNDALVRGNSVAALKAIGGPRVFEVVIEHWNQLWGGSARAHAVFGTQRSYIADYDISGDTYDPVVRNFITGAVVDSNVVKVESDLYYVTLREITPFETKQPLPNNPAAWEKWLQKERPRLLADADKKRSLAKATLDGADEE